MTHPHLRALVLAAGRGERLRPLTARRPKPLLPVAGRSILAHTLDRLAELGCRDVAINLHYLGDQIRTELGPRHGPLALTYSSEPILLGTLGALAPLHDFFAGANAILVINGDSLCPWPLADLLATHETSGAAATFLLSRQANPADFGGGLSIDARGRILGFRGDPAPAAGAGVAARRVFAGAHILDPELLSGLVERPADIIGGLYEPLLARGAHLQSVSTHEPWHDLGTPSRYLAGVLDWVSRGAVGTRPGDVWASPTARVHPTARLASAVLESAVEVGAGVRLERVLLLPRARVGAGAVLRDAIVDAGASVAAGASIEGAVVSAAGPGDEIHTTAPDGRTTPFGA